MAAMHISISRRAVAASTSAFVTTRHLNVSVSKTTWGILSSLEEADGLEFGLRYVRVSDRILYEFGNSSGSILEDLEPVGELFRIT